MAELQPIAPPDVNNPVPIGVDSPVVDTSQLDIHTMYEDAANSGNPASMYALTSRVKGTPYEEPIRRSATVMQKAASEIEEIAKPVVEAGVGTPKGNIAASKAFETVADNPQKMRAFAEMLMGNPKWRTFVTGGTPTTSIVYDKQGNMLEKTVNELGQIVSVVDSSSGKPINRDELAQRGGLVPSLEQAIGYQQEKKLSEINTADLAKSSARTNAWQAAAPELKNLNSELRDRLKSLMGSDLSNEQRNLIGAFTNRSMGYGETVSEGLNALQQKIDNKNVSLSASQQKSMGSVLGALGFEAKADGSIVNKKGEAVTKTDLEQAQKSLTNGANFEKQFNQSKEDFLKNAVFNNLGEEEKKVLGRALDLQRMIQQKTLEIGSVHGSMPFLMNPKGYEVGDEFARGEAQALVGEFNADATEMFGRWREQQLAKYPKGKAPAPGELEAAFSRTPQFNELRKVYAERNREVLNRPVPSGMPAQNWEEQVGVKSRRIGK
jgi:hypothetical protein